MELLIPATVSILFIGGGLVHRLTGMGFSLLAVPPLVLLLGPVDGVTVAALGALLASVGVGFRARRSADRPLSLLLVVAVLAGTVVGVLVAVVTPTAVMTPVIGAITIAAVAATVVLRYVATPVVRASAPRAPFVVAGLVSGAMNATSAIGGPPLSVTASWMGMRHEVFVSTVQLPFVVMGAVAVLARTVALGVPGIAWGTWGIALLAVGAGVLLGDVLRPRVREAHAWIATLAISAAGGVALMLSGGGSPAAA